MRHGSKYYLIFLVLFLFGTNETQAQKRKRRYSTLESVNFDQTKNVTTYMIFPFGTVNLKGRWEEFDKLLDEVGVEHEVIMYPNSGHAFFRDSDPSVYIPDASNDAWERAKKFFSKHLV